MFESMVLKETKSLRNPYIYIKLFIYQVGSFFSNKLYKILFFFFLQDLWLCFLNHCDISKTLLQLALKIVIPVPFNTKHRIPPLQC